MRPIAEKIGGRTLGLGIWLMLLVHLSGGGSGCGTDVGNAGKPKAESSLALSEVVEVQFDEAIESVIDSFDQDELSLSLLASAVDPAKIIDASCQANPEDGSITSVRSESRQKETERGRAAKRRTRKDTVLSRSEIQFFPKSPGDPLACQDQIRPSLRRNQFDGLRLKGSYEKEREQTTVLQADGSLLKQTKLVSTSQREARLEVVSVSAQSMVWRRESKFVSSLRLENKDKDLAIERKVESIEPIVIEKTRVVGQGLTEVKIVQGAVQSAYEGEKKIILRYDNLVLGIGADCLPSVGQIKGEVYADKDALSPEATFLIKFSAEGATLQDQNGSEKDLELETCRL